MVFRPRIVASMEFIFFSCLHFTGIEVVKVDMDDKASCKEALKGAYGVFLVTNFWEIHDEEREVLQVRGPSLFSSSCNRSAGTCEIQC
jgi:uncharacterized protein YbjT (DUF2867 family)